MLLAHVGFEDLKALYSTQQERKTRRAFLIGIELKGRPASEAADSLDELAQLARSAGAQVVGRGIQRLEKPNAATYIGSGKAEEFSELCKREGVDTVVFDEELTPAQVRNLERIFSCKILDRTDLILEIFARRARSREGKLQVELAQLQHVLPRLMRYWTHLSRQKGGIGLRGGEGESQLEADRRRVQERIDRLQAELEEVKRIRQTQRAGRQRNHWPLVSLVGYTNAGKSTLFNALTGANVLEEDLLFATLDPTVRRVRLPGNQNILLSDTVGFIRKLPHQLIEAFKATLEEVVNADLLLHVVDISHPQAREQIEAVNKVLREICADDKPIILVLNKTDLLHNGDSVSRWLDEYPSAVPVSAKTTAGFPELLGEIGIRLKPPRDQVRLIIPQREGSVLARLHAVGEIVWSSYRGNFAHFQARIPPHLKNEFAPYMDGNGKD
ncbi:MAG: GTPase HflX [Verrucomicrobiae bacterium]|nr:GTPase HflX [Verrucomicrobiae bacterium]